MVVAGLVQIQADGWLWAEPPQVLLRVLPPDVRVVNVLVLRPGDSNFCALSESALSEPELVRRRRRSRGEETGEQSGGGDRGAERGRGRTG